MTISEPIQSARTSRPRFRSLDAFRGATVALMILVNNPGSWSSMYEPLQHAKWHGCTPTDLVFPFFLFAVGNALAFVMQSASDSSVWIKVLRRTLLIFLIGLFLNAFPFVAWNKSNVLEWKSWDTLRILGVLQRIALSFGAAAIIVRYFARDGETFRVLWISTVLLVGYWIACLVFRSAADPYSLEGFFGTSIDRTVLQPNHLYKGEGVPFDPEGLVSTIPSIVQVLLGWWVGRMILSGPANLELLGRLFLAATYMLTIAYLWQLSFPLNKKIWTSTFTLYTTGLATLGLSMFIHLMDIRKITDRSRSMQFWERCITAPLAWLVPCFEAFGKNPLFIFVLSGILPRLLGLIRWQSGATDSGEPIWTSPLPWVFNTFFKSVGTDPRLGSSLYSVALLVFYWLIVWALDKRRIYIRV